MAEQSPITPGKIIEQLGITPITLRRWCAYHKAHLSPGANPGEGVTRRFIGRDLEVLRHVRSLRDQGLTTEQINEQLAGLTFPEIEPGVWPDGTPTNTNAVEPVPASQEGPGSPQLPVRVLDDHETRLDRLERSLVEVQGEARPRWWWFVAGVGVGLGAAAVAELFALVASRGH